MSIELEIRPFQAADAEAITELWNEALPRSKPWNDPTFVMCRKRQLGDGLFLVGIANKRLVATAVAGYDGIRGWIYAFAVAADFRRQGVGRRMLQAAEAALITKGCPKVNLQVMSSNSEVVAFYESCGFSVEDRVSLGRPLPQPSEPADPVPDVAVSTDVCLSQVTWEDKPAYLQHFNDSTVFHENMGVIPYPYLEFDADQFIFKERRGFSQSTETRNWAIRNRSGALIGGIGFHHLEIGERAELSYWLARPYWGRGIMTSAGKALCAFAFEQYALQRIYARAFAINPASARVLEKIGFTHEGTLRNHFRREGRSCDVLLYGLLADD